MMYPWVRCFQMWNRYACAFISPPWVLWGRFRETLSYPRISFHLWSNISTHTSLDSTENSEDFFCVSPIERKPRSQVTLWMWDSSHLLQDPVPNRSRCEKLPPDYKNKGLQTGAKLLTSWRLGWRMEKGKQRKERPLNLVSARTSLCFCIWAKHLAEKRRQLWVQGVF